MKKQFGIMIFALIAMCGVVATAAHAYDVTELRNTPAGDAPGRLQSQGFRFVGTYSDFDNEWKMWFNRGTGECVGYTQKGRQVKRARSFGHDRCRNADRGYGDRDRGYGDRGYGDGDRGGYGDRDRDDYRDGVPGWMVGYFRGYNRTYGTDVSLDISPDGNVVATVNGRRSYGEFRHGKLRVGMNWFYVERDRDGLTTRQIGDEDNIVRYRRR